MNLKQWKIYLGILLFLGLYFALQEANRAPEPISWSPSFSRLDKIPYGTWVLFDRLSDIFPGNEAILVEQDPYTYLELEGNSAYYSSWDDLDPDFRATYLFINQEFFPDIESLDALLQFAYTGNLVFISAESFSEAVEDSLHIQAQGVYFGFGNQPDVIPGKFVDPLWKPEGYYDFHREGFLSFFQIEDSSSVRILAQNNQGKANFIWVPYGEGGFYLSSTPLAYTNYHLLDSLDMAEFVSASLSYLPESQDMLWDTYYKWGNEQRRRAAEHPLQFINSQPPLKWAFWLLVLALGIYALFESKRRLPIIPIVAPFTNTTLEFTETIGSLYFQKGDHKNLAEKKIRMFLADLHHRFGISVQKLDESFVDDAYHYLGIDKDKLKDLVIFIKKIRGRTQLSEEELIAFSQLLEECKQKMR